MNPITKKLVPVFVAALCACGTPMLLSPQELSASDLEISTATAMKAADRLTVKSDGSVCYEQGDEFVTGKFSLEPNYMLGDMNHDGKVDAQDAAVLLILSASKGASADGSISEMDELYGDVDENGDVNASDSANILRYSALVGAGEEVHPFGFAYYYADKNGKLLKGRIDDPSGESYYAGEDYQLITGWFDDDEQTYCFDNEGVMYKNTWLEVKNDQKLWMTATGEMAAGVWADTDNGRCWFDTDGTPADGLRILDEKPYYFENNALQTGWITIGERRCYAGKDGVLVQGVQKIDSATYYFGNGFGLQGGWVKLDDGLRYFDENGKMCTGWALADGIRYCFDDNGLRMSGFVDSENGTCYLDADGICCTGWQTINDKTYFFTSDNAVMATGWLDVDGKRYYFGEDGIQQKGWVEVDGNKYYLDENGAMVKGIVEVDGTKYDFGTDGVSKGEYVPPVSNTGTGKDDLLNTASLSPRRTITVYDQQKGTGKSKVDFTFTLSDRDIEIIEQFAAENFPENASLAEKLYITHQWIHYNNDYAYAGWKWNEIVGCSYVDAIFNHRKGQCVQYNGAMASVLAYYGFDVYMVKGYTDSGNQHFWTQVEIDGHTYMVECGNSGKNGDWWQEFFNLMY
ncbi:MAG: arylamine N-acetyltransferase [Oscillospiraceae bacterium]|nr:arylamine N-acetyltransferase [Oscillospiraceae bacterium]